MKSIGITLLICLWCLDAEAQESRFFDYDREQVRCMLETINETTIGPCENCFAAPFAGDSVQGSTRKYFRTGALGGILGCLGGVGAGYLGGEVMNMGTAVGWAGLVTGTVLGFVVPQIIVARKAKDPQNSNAALRGSTLAVSVGIIGLLYIFMVGEWKASPAF
jgi:hypothetical protein